MSKYLSARYYWKKKQGKASIKTRERYQDLPKKAKNKKREYGRERYKHILEDQKGSYLGIEKSILKYGKIKSFYK